MICVVVGGTGLVGRELIAKLLAEPGCEKVISFSRSSLGIKHEKLAEFRAGDLAELSNFRGDLKGDSYFCCLGTTIKVAGSKANFSRVDYDAVVEFGRIAKFHGAKNFVLVSATGANPSSLFFYNQVKGAVEDALQVLELARLIIFRPGLLLGERKEFRLGEKIFTHALDYLGPLFPTSFARKYSTQAKVLAERMWQEANRTGPACQVVEASEI